MSLLDGLKDSLKNPLAENNDEMEFILESDFETALEKAIDVKLSPADIAAILNGDDDIDDEDDDIDDPDDDIDKDMIDDLQKVKEALEATMAEIGIDTAADELGEDDDLDDPELDPEDENEILSEESVKTEVLDPEPLPEDEAKATKKAETGEASIPENLKDPTPDGDEHQIKKDKEALEAVLAALEGKEPECEIEKAKVTKVADTGEASIPKNSGKIPEDVDKLTHETGDASIPENTKDPTPDGDEHQIKKDEEALEALIAALESDDKPEIDHDPSATECDTTETGDASTLANADDATPDGDTEDPAGAENDAKGEECDTDACESKKEDKDSDDSDSDDDKSDDKDEKKDDDKKSDKDSKDDDESDDDEDEKKKDKKSKKEDSDDDSDKKDEDEEDSDKDDDKEDKKSDKKDKDDDKDEKKDEDDEPSLESILDDLLSL